MLRGRGRLWPTVITLLGVALGISLGNWQLGRAAQKRDLKERLEARAAQPPISVGTEELIATDLELRRVEARGVFAPQHVIFIDNRIHRGVPGYHVVMPLRVEGGERHVLVNRGWIARSPLRSQLPQVQTPTGTVTITGTAMIPAQRTLELSDKVIEGRIWQNLTIARYREAAPLPIQPFLIQQDTHAPDDGLVREWPSPEFGIDKHYGYAFQWFALAATLVVFYVVTQLKRANAGDPPGAR